MIGSSPFKGYGYIDTTNHTPEQLEKYAKNVALRRKAGLEDDGYDGSFAARLKRADEYLASGQTHKATDSIGIVLYQMDDPTPGHPVTEDFWHNGTHVSVTKDCMYGNTITIGGSANPDWIYVSTSVGAVKIDLNDMTSLMKCLDLFSPEDVNAIMRKITEVKQAREAKSQIDRLDEELMKNNREEADEDGKNQSIDEAVGVISAEEQQHIEEKRDKKFIG
ncbi:hypothetical protein D7V83_04510 [bacterium 0.1xD8-71]|nr:hypothetical protein D7V83_04510 [bacterium 0.1xD8-71]